MPTSPRIHLPYPDEDSSPWNEVFKSMVEAIDLSLYSHREDRNTIFSGGGLMSFTANTGLLTWSLDVDLLAAFTGYRWRIQGPAQIVISDSQLAYITISRAPQSLNVVQMVVGQITPNEPRGDDHYVICYRKGSRVYFRNGKVINDGQIINIFDQSGGIVIKDEGSYITGGNPTDTLNFVGPTVTAADAGNGVVNITVEATVYKDEGVPVAGAPHTSVNFIGPTVAATDGGSGQLDVTVTPTIFQEEGVPVPGAPHTIVNFIGPTITATDAGGGQLDLTVTPGVDLQDEGVTVPGGPFTVLNFLGSTIQAVDAGGGVADVTVTPGVNIEEEGVAIPGNPHTTLNFVGATVQATDAGGGVCDVTVIPTTYKEEGVFVPGAPHYLLNFIGPTITATDAGGGQLDVTVGATAYEDEGVAVPGGPHFTVNFIGPTVTATDAGSGVLDVTIVPTSFKDEGTPVAGAPHTVVNFVGPTVAATDAGGGELTVTVNATAYEDDGVAVPGAPHITVNFIGDLVAATDAGSGKVDVTIFDPIMTTELVLVAGLHSHDNATPARVGGRYLDLSPYPASLGTLTRQVTFRAELETTVGTAEIRLRNVTDAEDVTGTTLNTVSTTGVEVSGSVTVGAGAGDLKTGKHYALEIWITGGGVTDRATCTNARLEISYV